MIWIIASYEETNTQRRGLTWPEQRCIPAISISTLRWTQSSCHTHPVAQPAHRTHTHTPICTNTRSHAHAPVLEHTHTHTYTLKPATDCIGLCCCPTRLKRNTPKKSSKKVKILNSIWGEVFSLKPLRAGFNFSASKIQLQVNWNPSSDSTEPF